MLTHLCRTLAVPILFQKAPCGPLGCSCFLLCVGETITLPLDIFQIQQRYKAATGYLPIVFDGSSPGAGKFGYLKIRRRRPSLTILEWSGRLSNPLCPVNSGLLRGQAAELIEHRTWEAAIHCVCRTAAWIISSFSCTFCVAQFVALPWHLCFSRECQEYI